MMRENTEVFLSNRLETLADLLKTALFFSGLKPFEKRVVIVPCESTKSFLIHRFAQDPQLEIAAGDAHRNTRSGDRALFERGPVCFCSFL